MRIQSGPPGLPRKSPPPAVQQPHSTKLIDELKRRSTLVNMIDPMGMTLGIVSQPKENLRSAETIATSFYHGDTATAKSEIEKVVDRAVHPKGVFNVMYKSGQVLGAVVDGTVGGLEVVDGLQHGNHHLAMMGVADFVGGTASAVVAAGFPGVSLGFTVLAAAGKTGLVMSRPDQFSRIQKASTVFDAGWAVGNSCLRAGVAVVPALCAETALGATQLLYMNVDGFRHKVDDLVDWAVSQGKSNP